MLERNNYRQSLIDYSQDRRQYIQFIDGIHQNMRNLVRNLEQLQTNLDIQRRAVAISIRRVDLTRENLSQPKPPAAPGEKPQQFGDTAALDLLNALSDLRNTQNNFMSVWLNHYATRMTLDRELGTMQLDERGRWIDREGEIPTPSDIEELELPPPVPAGMIEELNRAVAVIEKDSAPRSDRRTGTGLDGHLEVADRTGTANRGILLDSYFTFAVRRQSAVPLLAVLRHGRTGSPSYLPGISQAGESLRAVRCYHVQGSHESRPGLSGYGQQQTTAR